MTDTAAGSLSDVADALRAARPTINPWWLRLINSAAFAAVMTLLFGGKTPTENYALVFALLGAIVVTFPLIQRHRGIGRARRVRGPVPPLIVAAYFAVLVTFTVLWVAVLLIASWWLPHDSVQSSAAVFVMIFALWSAYMFAVERIAALRQSQPAQNANSAGTFDDLLAPRLRLMLSTVLSVVKSMRVDRLARTLDASVPELSGHITELAGAQYVHAGSDAKGAATPWISMTGSGSAAYAGHIQALRVRSIPSPW